MTCSRTIDAKGDTVVGRGAGDEQFTAHDEATS